MATTQSVVVCPKSIVWLCGWVRIAGAVMTLTITVAEWTAPKALKTRTHNCVVLVSDGIRSGFARQLDASLPPAALAERLLGGCARDSDDATAFVARYLGTA